MKYENALKADQLNAQKEEGKLKNPFKLGQLVRIKIDGKTLKNSLYQINSIESSDEVTIILEGMPGIISRVMKISEIKPITKKEAVKELLEIDKEKG